MANIYTSRYIIHWRSRKMAQDSITIKGTRGGLLILLDASKDFNELKNNLINKFTTAKGFFKGAPFALVPTSPLSLQETAELKSICEKHGLVPSSNIAMPIKRTKKVHKIASTEPSLAQENNEQTLLREGTLRNGHELVYDGNVMFLGDIHLGATIKASGNILIMGTLKGKAHAGIKGKKDAVIVAYKFEPQLISIAGIVACSPNQKSEPFPEIAKLINEKIIVEPYMSKVSRNTSFIYSKSSRRIV